MTKSELKAFLEEQYYRFNTPEFIPKDPISIPHKFTKVQDIEISGFWVAMLSWGKRETIVNKGNELMVLMDNSPHDFVVNCSDHDLKSLMKFKHRTFNSTDSLYFVEFFKNYYESHSSLEQAFIPDNGGFTDMKSSISYFHQQFFNSDYAPERTKKHVATPDRNSACKRVNMFLRWMVREDNHGVDFGIWNKIKPRDLICPFDVHVERTARSLGLISRKQPDWKTATELTENLRLFDVEDPVKYDFALFGLSIMK